MRVACSLTLLVTLAAPLAAQAGLFWDTPGPKPSNHTGSNTSALGQLEGMTGQKVDRFKASPTYRQPQAPAARSSQAHRSSSDQMAAGILAGMFASLLFQPSQGGARPGDSALAGHNARQADLLAKLAQQQEEAKQRDQVALRSWAQNHADQLNRQLLSQRGTAFFGAPAGDPMVVDLSDARALTPVLPGTVPMVPEPVTADLVLQRRQDAQARLKRMMEEDEDLKVVGERFYELEEQLTRLKREAQRLGSDGRQLAREHEAWGAAVEQAVQNSLERGTSLLTGTILKDGTAQGLQTLRKNPALWNGTMESLAQVHDFIDFVTERAERVETAREAVDWAQAKRSFFKDLDFVASNLGKVSKAWDPVSVQWELGKNILGSGLDVAKELDAWGFQKGAEAEPMLLKQRQQAVLKQMTGLVGNLQGSRELIAGRLGVRPEDLIPIQARPKGLGSLVPPL